MKTNALILLLLLPSIGLPDERILDYHSDILIRQDGWIEVTETIEVRAEGVNIRRGIYRDYPTRYEWFGNDVEVDYEPVSVMRDGYREDFHTEKRANGVRTYFGSAERFLDPGEYTYTYRYDAGRMLGFFDTRDELYWNVTGLGWDFPIDHASATVTFDFDLAVDDIGVDAFTGGFGDQGRNYAASIDGAGRAQFETTAPLGLREGLTVVVNWPKGHVDEPGAMQKAAWLLSDNANLLVALAGLLALFAYYVPVWRKHGRDPEEGLVVTRYEPPDGFSPASLRYIENMGYDNKAMTAAVVNLAVKGYLRIDKNGDLHSLQRIDPGASPPRLAAGEKELLDGLFRDGNTVVLENENHELLGEARSRHGASLKRDYANRYFITNGAMNLPAILVIIVAAVIALNVGSGATPAVIGILIVMAIVIVVFAILMKRPTGIGRKVLDETAGFKDYLEIAEKEEMNLRNPPEKTPELFERYLPFALAMGVDQQWTERFAAVFASLREPGGTPYHPVWYTGAWNAHDFSAATSNLTSELGTAISSSVTAPGSSSGSGGGGFSGGGGGGGGGGGW